MKMCRTFFYVKTASSFKIFIGKNKTRVGVGLEEENSHRVVMPESMEYFVFYICLM